MLEEVDNFCFDRQKEFAQKKLKIMKQVLDVFDTNNNNNGLGRSAIGNHNHSTTNHRASDQLQKLLQEMEEAKQGDTPILFP